MNGNKKTIDLNELMRRPAFRCACGKTHSAHLKEALICEGAIQRLSPFVRNYGGTKVYVLADENTFAAAGRQALQELTEEGVPYTLHLFGKERAEPDEKMIGAAFAHFDHSCDMILAVGSGVINDISKIVAKTTGHPLITVATAPSMDGYASSTSSIVRDGLKVSVESACPAVIIGDLNVLKNAPLQMIRAGLGDMLAKYISVTEWRIGQIVTGEYYCEDVAALIRAALKTCVDNARGILTREPAAVKAVMEGLILSGVAADWAGVSRPVSGVEHYFSHIWDMRALEFGSPFDLHGVQCGIGTLYALRGYRRLQSLSPDEAAGKAAFAAFDREALFGRLRALLGNAADPMISAARTADRYDPEKHAARLKTICGRWNEILAVIREELPPFEEIKALLTEIGAPVNPADIGLPNSDAPAVFAATKDIRDKYILSTLAFDIGALDEIAEEMKHEN